MASAGPVRGRAIGDRAAPPPRADEAALPVEQRGLLTVGIMLATMMQILDSTIANVALPHMQTALGATADTITWVLTSYIVASAVAIPITGWLSDRVGSRNLFLASTVAFIVASMLCGLASSLPEMVAFRILQGTAAAFMNPLSQTAMLDINPQHRQAKAMSIWGMGVMIGPILGPVIGGYLTDNYNWRWVFYVNLPLGILCLAILWALLPSRPVREQRFDLLGFSLLAISIASFQLMLDRGQSEDWFRSTEVLVELAVAASTFWMFLVHLFTARQPIFDRTLLADRNLLTGLGFMMVVGVLMMATMALLPPLLQRVYGYPVLDAGLLLMPRGVGILISMFVSGQLLQRQTDPRILVGAGFSIAAVSLWQMTQWSLIMSADAFVISGFVQGVGLGLVFTALSTMAFATMSPAQRTEGASLLNLARSIGASIGISTVTALLARNTQLSHMELGGHITGFSMDAVDPGITSLFGAAGSTVTAMLDAEVTRQALMIAYLDDFKLMMILTIAAIPLVFLLRRPPRTVQPGDDPIHAALE